MHNKVVSTKYLSGFYFSTDNSISKYCSNNYIPTKLISFNIFDRKHAIFTKNGENYIFPESDSKIVVYSTLINETIFSFNLDSGPIIYLDISSNNSTLVSCTKNKVYTWSMKTCTLNQTKIHSVDILIGSISQQEDLLALAFCDKKVVISCLKTLSEIRIFSKCISVVTSLYFSPDDIYLLIGEENGCVRGFDLYDHVQRFLIYTKNPVMKIEILNEFIYVRDTKNELKAYDRNIAKKINFNRINT